MLKLLTTISLLTTATQTTIIGKEQGYLNIGYTNNGNVYNLEVETDIKITEIKLLGEYIFNENTMYSPSTINITNGKGKESDVNDNRTIYYIVQNETLDKYLGKLGTINKNTYTVYDITIPKDTKLELTINKEINYMEELLTALTTAVQSAVSIFVQGFGGLTQIFYNGTEITFIGGILIVGLAVMFLMMFLRWIVSFVKGI